MDNALAAQLALIEGEVRAAAISADAKKRAVWCLGQLSAMYDRYCETRESRYGDEITRLVRAVLMTLADDPGACPASAKLATGITDRFGLLHAEFGLPGLQLKLATAPRAPARKAGKLDEEKGMPRRRSRKIAATAQDQPTRPKIIPA